MRFVERFAVGVLPAGRRSRVPASRAGAPCLALSAARFSPLPLLSPPASAPRAHARSEAHGRHAGFAAVRMARVVGRRALVRARSLHSPTPRARPAAMRSPGVLPARRRACALASTLGAAWALRWLPRYATMLPPARRPRPPCAHPPRLRGARPACCQRAAAHARLRRRSSLLWQLGCRAGCTGPRRDALPPPPPPPPPLPPPFIPLARRLAAASCAARGRAVPSAGIPPSHSCTCWPRGRRGLAIALAAALTPEFAALSAASRVAGLLQAQRRTRAYIGVIHLVFCE